MTLGEYPGQGPAAYLIPLDAFRSKLDVGRFENVAPRVGLASEGPNMAGGSIFDDFNGDGLPDLFTTSLDADLGASLFVNRGDGTFEDRSAAAGLGDQVYALNVARADFDNDGELDVLLLRGGWEKPARLSLLRNKGERSVRGRDRSPAAWASRSPPSRPPGATTTTTAGSTSSSAANISTRRQRRRPPADPATAAGSTTTRATASSSTSPPRPASSTSGGPRESAWGDYDDDGRLDLFVSNMDGPAGSTTTRATAHSTTSPPSSASPGPPLQLLLLVLGLRQRRPARPVRQRLRSRLWPTSWPTSRPDSRRTPSHPRLYRNLGAEGFRDVSREVGLDRPIPAMGSNFGDIDNDGFLDLYLGTGWMAYSGLVPNVMFKNVEGRRFEDVTESTGTGHLQKGHGVSFADWDCDGDLDLFVVLGGGYPGDRPTMSCSRTPATAVTGSRSSSSAPRPTARPSGPRSGSS